MKFGSAAEQFRQDFIAAGPTAAWWNWSKRMLALHKQLAKAKSPHDQALRGWAALRLGDSTGARAAERQLDAMERLPYITRAELTWARALLAAAAGDRERAVAILRSVDEAPAAGPGSWHGTSLFELLRDYPPFQEMIKARK